MVYVGKEEGGEEMGRKGKGKGGEKEKGTGIQRRGDKERGGDGVTEPQTVPVVSSASIASAGSTFFSLVAETRNWSGPTLENLSLTITVLH